MIRLVDVGHRYGDRDVLTGLDLELGAGRVGLIGVNGAGKSTLMRILTTAAEPTTGTVDFAGLGATRRRIVANIGYLPQDLRPPPALRGADFLAYVAWLKGIPRRARGAEIDRVTRAVGLSDRVGDRIGSLSGGMHRRLLLAQSVIGDPAVVVLDEPTAGLDPEQRVRFRELVAGLDARLVIVSSHALEDLVPIVDRMVMLEDRRIAFDGSVEGLGVLGDATPIAGMSRFESGFLRVRMANGGSLP